MTRTLRCFRRWAAARRSRNYRICTRFPASDSGIPLALPIAVAALIQNGRRPPTERLETRDVGCVVTFGSSSSTVIGCSCRIGVRTMAKGRVAVPVVVTAACAVLFFGLGTYLGARPNVGPQQELAAMRAEISLLRRQQELAPTPAAGVAPSSLAVEAHEFDKENVDRAALIADVKRQLQTEMGLLPLTLIRERRHSFVELYSDDDRGASSYGTAGYLGNGYFITVKHAVVALGHESASDPRVINSISLMINGRPISARVVDAGDARVEVDPGDWAILKVKEDIDLPAIACRTELSLRVR